MLAVSMDLNDVLTHAVETGATDVHFKLGQPPVLRSDAALAPARVFPALDDDNLATILDTVTASAPRRREPSTRPESSTSHTRRRGDRALG